MDSNKLKQTKSFFEYDLKCKKLLNESIPIEMDFYDPETKSKYIDKLAYNVDKMGTYISKMLVNYDMTNLFSQFYNNVQKLQDIINSPQFYSIIDKGYDSTLSFVNENITDMRVDFVNSVYRGFIGYSSSYGEGVLEPITISEYLHYAHSFITNNSDFYHEVPIIQEMTINNHDVKLRGIPTELGAEIFETILANNISSSCIDIINLEEQIFIMGKDLGHATVFQLDLSEPQNIMVNYFIAKNNNPDMMNHLKGINANNKDFATGCFQTEKEKLANDVCDIMKRIPNDLIQQYHLK